MVAYARLSPFPEAWFARFGTAAWANITRYKALCCAFFSYQVASFRSADSDTPAPTPYDTQARKLLELIPMLNVGPMLVDRQPLGALRNFLNLHRFEIPLVNTDIDAVP